MGAAAFTPTITVPTRVLHIVGTAHARWHALAQAVAAGIGSGPRGSLRVVPQGTITPAEEAAGVRWLVLVDSPEAALAHWVAADGEGTPGEALATWSDSARRLLNHVHASRGRCLLIDAEEAAANADGLAATLSGWLGVACGDLTSTQLPAAGALQRLVAREICSGDGRVALLHDELQASCVSLHVQSAAPTAATAAYRVTAGLDALSDLRRATDAQRRLANEQTLRRHGELMARQLHQALEELDALAGRARALERQLAEARETPPAARTTPDATNLKSHRAGSARITHVRDAAPHREVRFSVNHLTLGERQFPTMALKLVEHRGLPGIAIFAGADGSRALARWEPSGEEDGRSYVLLIPHDVAGRCRLDLLGKDDWRSVQGLAELLSAAVHEAGTHLANHWSVIARRLLVQLRQLPLRLRYDRLEVSAASVDSDPVLDILIDQAMMGERVLPPARLRWRPRAATQRLLWLLDADSADDPPLAHWPVREDGTLQPELALPLGPGFSWQDRLRWWSNLGQTDRELALSIVDTLRAAVGLLPDGDVPSGSSRPKSELERAASGLRRSADQTLVLARLNRVIRRLIRRVGRGRSR
jgi:hypothetical protein